MLVRLTKTLFITIVLFCLLVISPDAKFSADAADKALDAIWVMDALTTPGQPAVIEARLNAEGPVTTAGVGGEPLALLVHGEIVATGMTGEDGRAVIRYGMKTQGVFPIHVQVGQGSRVSPTEGDANLAVWEQRNPIVAIELAALMDESSQRHFSDIGFNVASGWKPMSDAADELAKLTQFYYRVIYVVPLPSSTTDGFRASAEAREWLKVHRFPPGYVLVVSSGDEAWGEKLDELHQGGWKTVKVGVGRSRSFVESFLKRRLEAVMVLEAPSDHAPRKAKVARDWREVRKKL